MGTAAYLAPELYKPSMKYSQKVDIYSLGLIFFEMCHPPPSTMMERQKLVADIRRKDINLPESFEEEKRPKQVWMEEAGRRKGVVCSRQAGGRESGARESTCYLCFSLTFPGKDGALVVEPHSP